MLPFLFAGTFYGLKRVETFLVPEMIWDCDDNVVVHGCFGLVVFE